MHRIGRVLVYLPLLKLNGWSVLRRAFHHYEEGSMMFIVDFTPELSSSI